MNLRLKKILLILGFALIVFGFAFGLYWFFFRSSPSAVTPTPGTVTPGGQLPTAGEGVPGGTPTTPGVSGLPQVPGTGVGNLPSGVPSTGRTTVLRTEPTQQISMSSSGLRSYNPNDGRFYKINANGDVVPLSNQTFFGVQKVDWGNNSDQAILNFPDGSNVYYNFATNNQVTLPQYWEDFSFSPNDAEIAAKAVGGNENNRFLVVSNPDGTNARPVEDLGANQDKVHVDWSPNNQAIAYSFTGDSLGFDRQSIVLVGKNQENFKSLVVEGRGFVPNWSPTGDNMVYSVYSSNDNYLPSLWFSGASGDNTNANRQNLNLPTWADKCAWQSQTVVICGVPTQLDTGAGLQRDAFRQVPDEIYKLNLETGERINLGQPQGGAAVDQMTITPDGSAAMFTDAITGKLIRFNL